MVVWAVGGQLPQGLHDMSGGKSDYMDVGVIHLATLTSQDLPNSVPGTGLLSWTGSTLGIRYDAQGPVDTTFPTNAQLANTKTGTLAQNIGITGTSVENTVTLLGAVYLPAGTLDEGSCKAYMTLTSGIGKITGTVSITNLAGDTSYATFALDLASSPTTSLVAVSPNPTAFTDGWYRIVAQVSSWTATETVTLHGLRLTYV